LETINYFGFVKERNISESNFFPLSGKFMKNIPFGPFGAADLCIQTEQKKAGDKR